MKRAIALAAAVLLLGATTLRGLPGYDVVAGHGDIEGLGAQAGHGDIEGLGAGA
jgi:hypothetical protein